MSEGWPEIHPSAQMYYDRATLDAALADARTRIEEWSYEDDAHGYCHERPDWLRLVEEVERRRTARADAWAWGYTAGFSNAMRRMSDEPHAPTSPNPYRATEEDER